MLVSENHIHPFAFSSFSPHWPQQPLNYSLPLNGRGQDDAMVFVRPLQPPQQQGISFGQFLAGAAVVGAVLWGVAEMFSPATRQRMCGVCGRPEHDRRTCSYDGARVGFPRSIPKSGQCECCGSSRYETQRHHTRGRSSLSDFLDVCFDCHLGCCHGGHFQNLGSKPRACRVTGNRSLWCN